MSIVCFGEIMLRLNPPDGLRLAQAQALELQYGGSEANVAVSLALLGKGAKYATRVPDNDLGHSALGALSRHGVHTAHSIFGGERLGIYFLEYGAGRRSARVIYDRGASGMATLSPGMFDWQEIFRDAEWFHWSGITPALSESAAAATAEALETAAEMGLTISCDLNYRDKLWKYGKSPAEVMPALIRHTDVVLGDATAFGKYFGIKAGSDEQLLRDVCAAFPKLKYAAMSSREGFSADHHRYQAMLFDRRRLLESRVHEMPDMLDRIGGGDAFMAGLIFGLYGKNADLQEVLEFATAAAVMKHYIKGDFNLCAEQEIRDIMDGDSGGKVKR